MKTYQRIGWIVGAAMLQTIHLGNSESAIGQTLTASEQATSMMAASISAPTDEVIRLAQSGVTDEVVIAFVNRSQGRFALSEETIIYLKDLGLAPELIAAMIEHDGGRGSIPHHPTPRLRGPQAPRRTAQTLMKRSRPPPSKPMRRLTRTIFTPSFLLTEPGLRLRALAGAGNRTAVFCRAGGGPIAMAATGPQPGPKAARPF
jgi:hypothetical protein